jgi:hypothetical protein
MTAGRSVSSHRYRETAILFMLFLQVLLFSAGCKFGKNRKSAEASAALAAAIISCTFLNTYHHNRNIFMELLLLSIDDNELI